MKKLLPVFIIITTVFIMLCGCENPFVKNKETMATTVATVLETTTEGNSEVVTLADETTQPTKSKKVIYYSQNMCATFNLPASWLNNFAVDDSQDKKGNKYVTFYEKANHMSGEKLGEIFTYHLYLNDKYKNKGNYVEYGTVLIDGQTYYIVSTVPKTSHFDNKNKNLKKLYNSMNKEEYITSICENVTYDAECTVDKNGCSTTNTTTNPSNTATEPNRNNEGSTSVNFNNRGRTVGVPDTAGLVFPDISTKKLTAADVAGMSSGSIQTAINDICAIHGYNFTTPSIKEHYLQFSWYKPSSNYSESSFNEVEKYNYDFLQKYR